MPKHQKVIYIAVRLTIMSDKPITEEVYQDVVGECNYNVSYNQGGTSITNTEVTEISETYLQ